MVKARRRQHQPPPPPALTPPKGGHQSSISPEEFLSEEIKRRLAAVTTQLAEAKLPAPSELETIERLSKLKAALPVSPPPGHRRLIVAGLTVLAGLVLLSLAYIEIPQTSLEAEVRATRVELTLADKQQDLLLPGELGQVLVLSSAYLSGVTQMDPPLDIPAEEVSLAAPPPMPGIPASNLALRLQELALPARGPVSLSVAVTYRASNRGLRLTSQGTELATARFGEVISVPLVTSESARGRARGPPPVFQAIRPLRASGKQLQLDLFPLDEQQALTTLRDVEVSSIRFLTASTGSRSSLLGGTVFVSDAAINKFEVLPGDSLELKSAGPMLIRELTYREGSLTVRVSSTTTTSVKLGTGMSRSLMPTWFDWLRSHWPTQLYATLSALIAVGLGLLRWWKPSGGAT